MKRKVGDIVVVVANTSDHEFNVGESVRIVAVCRSPDEMGFDYKAEHLDGRDFWYINENEVK